MTAYDKGIKRTPVEAYNWFRTIAINKQKAV